MPRLSDCEIEASAEGHRVLVLEPERIAGYLFPSRLEP